MDARVLLNERGKTNEELEAGQSREPITFRRGKRLGANVPVERHVEQQAGLRNSTGIWPVWIRHYHGPHPVGVVLRRPSPGSLFE